MKTRKERLSDIDHQLKDIIAKVNEMENTYAREIEKVHPVYRKSALNLVHYLGFRSFDIDLLQSQLRDLGLPGLSNIEAHVLKSLLTLSSIINHLLGNPIREKRKGIISFKKSKKILNRNTKLLFGYKSKKRRTRIMVTLPGSAADDYLLVNHLMNLGMNSARINCAHDNPETWKKMIDNIHQSSQKLSKSCKIMMDLGGPKLRTGDMQAGPEIIHIRPEKDVTGKIVHPAKIWIAPPDIPPPGNIKIPHIPVTETWFKNLKRGDTIHLNDTRGKKVKLMVNGRKGDGRWGYCHSSAYISSGTEFKLVRPNNLEKVSRQLPRIPPLEQYIHLKVNDYLILHKNPKPGEPAIYDGEGKLFQHAHISCTLPEIFSDVKTGEPVFFDDGKIEGIVTGANEEELRIKITYAKDAGNKLKADKGINLPESDLKIRGLTIKDKTDLKFVALHADTVNLSFVNDVNDVQQLLDELDKYDTSIGIILKIETRKGFKNLPRIILTAMQTFPVGVMIARGDLAIETGWKNFATIQEEILRICEASHLPDVWATQVLENLAKKGVPSRAEITDAAMAQRAECVMLNKGAYIEKAVKMLDKILRRMQRFQKKKEVMLPKLEGAEKLYLSHDKFNI
ncbi:MAG: pyruvate kinase [Bacteroidales bacterium]|nr:pyruvate kinase [Bacteroidales bacterium]